MSQKGLRISVISFKQIAGFCQFFGAELDIWLISHTCSVIQLAGSLKDLDQPIDLLTESVMD